MKTYREGCTVPCALTLCVLGYALPCGATDPPAVTHSVIADDVQGYYNGERTSAYVLLATGLVSAGAGAVLVTRDGDFSRGLGWPLISLGALEAVGALFYSAQVGAELDRYSGLLTRDAAGFQREEATHIHGTTSRFVGYRLVELGLVLGGAGIATYGFAADQDVWKGIGLGVAAAALPLFVIDAINQGRAARYEDHVRRFDPTLTLQVGDRGGSVAVIGRF